MSNYEDIKSWIIEQIQDSGKLSFKNLLFVAGNSGIGKTYNINNICATLNLNVIAINSVNCFSSQELQDIIVKGISSSMVQLLQNISKDKIIIIDEFDTLMALDKTMNTTLFNLLSLEKFKPIPIICISTPETLKNIGNIKKKCQIINIENPEICEVIDIIKKYFPDRSNKILQNLAEKSKGNIAWCLSKTKYDMDYFDSIYNLSYKDRISKYISIDQLLLPLKMHENLILELQNKKTKIQDNNKFYKLFISNLILYDYWITINNNECAHELFTNILYILHKIPNKNNKNSKHENFTKMLSYMSLQKKNVKKMYNINFPLYQICNYHINIIVRNNIFFK